MASWSNRRKMTYTAITGAVVLGVGLALVFFVIYTPPTCFDRVQNGGEFGIDCGGSCEKLCASAFLPPSVAWTRFEEVSPGLYNIAAYVVNPNTEGEARNVPYHAQLYDNKGLLITEFDGSVTVPPHRNTLAFATMVSVGKRTPAKALFEFTAQPDWNKKSDTLSPLVVGEKKYTEDDAGSSLTVDLKNTSVNAIRNIAVYVVLYDVADNALGFSRTFIDEIGPGDTATAPYTWPFDRDGKIVSIEVLPVAE